MVQLTRRQLASLGAAALATFGLAPTICQAQQLTTFRIGISSPSVSILPVYFAEGEIAKKHGLELVVVSAEGGTRGLQVLMSGEINAMHVGLAPMVQANNKGAALRMISASLNTLPFVFYATKKSDPPIPKGSVVGISTFGSETDIAVSIVLRSLGLSRGDVQITQIGGTSQRFAAMTAGRIFIAPLLEPSITAAEERGFTKVVDLYEARTPWVFDGVVVPRQGLDKNSGVFENFLKAYLEGAHRGFADEKWAKEVIARRLRIRDDKIVDFTYKDYLRLMTRDASVSLEGAANVFARLKEIGLPVQSDVIADYIDTSIVDRLKKDGFIKKLEATYTSR
jgi:NitT/TauT family transport system substrate-binding protein